MLTPQEVAGCQACLRISWCTGDYKPGDMMQNASVRTSHRICLVCTLLDIWVRGARGAGFKDDRQLVQCEESLCECQRHLAQAQTLQTEL